MCPRIFSNLFIGSADFLDNFLCTPKIRWIGSITTEPADVDVSIIRRGVARGGGLSGLIELTHNEVSLTLIEEKCYTILND